MTEFDRRSVSSQGLAAAKSWTRTERLSRKLAGVYVKFGVVGVALFLVRKVRTKVSRRFEPLWSARKARALVKDDLCVPAKAGLPLLAVKATGGIGDYIVMARYLRDLAATGGAFEYDIYTNNPSAAGWVFSVVPGLVRIRSHLAFEVVAKTYPAAVVLGEMVDVRKLAQGLRGPTRRIHEALESAAAAAREVADFVEAHPLRNGDLADIGVSRGSTRRNMLHDVSGIPYGGDGLPLSHDEGVYARFGLRPRGYVTISNGYDTSVASRVVTKCYPYFSEVVGRLKRAFPDVKFVQVGSSTSLPIYGVDIDLVSRTSLKEAAAVIAGSALHIDNEGGLVHIAACYGVRSAVVFGPTNAAYFGYPRNLNLAPSFCGNCWWATPTWMEECPAGYGRARCMTDRDPAEVASRIGAVMSDMFRLACAAEA